MRKFIKKTLVVLINLFLFSIGFFLFNNVTYEITKYTLDNEIIDGIIVIGTFTVTVFICVHALPKIRILKHFINGLFFLISSIIVFLVFYLNYNITFEGKYKRYKLRFSSQIEQKVYLSIDYTTWANSTEVELDKWLAVDSVDVRIDRGIFGIQTFSNNIELVENKNCKPLKFYETYEGGGIYYSRQRCFNEAIKVYSEMINAYPKLHSGYYYRGRIQLIKKKYDLALNDFKIALKLLISSVDKSKMDRIKKIKMQNYLSKLIKSVNTDKQVKIESYLENSKIKYELETYLTLINYCNSKL